MARKGPVNVLRRNEILANIIKQFPPADILERATCEQLASALERIEGLKAEATEWQRLVERAHYLGPPDAEHKWLDHLISWRKDICDELLAMPAIVNRADMDRRHNLEFSIKLIDCGLGAAAHNSFVNLSSLRIAQFMGDAGYATKGPELCGPRGWLGSIPEVALRIEEVTMQRDEAGAALERALTIRHTT